MLAFIYILAFISTPMPVTATLGSTATFNCSATSTITWIFNGTVLEELNALDIKTSYLGRTRSLHVPATEEYNNTAVVCEVVIRNPMLRIESSDPAVLRVQGTFCM